MTKGADVTDAAQSSQGLTNKGAGFIWGILTALTLASSLLHLVGDESASAYGAMIFLAAGLKSRMVVLYYMEMRHADLSWRLAFELWVFATTAALIVLFLVTPGGA